MQPSLGSLGQFLLTKINLSKLSKLHATSLQICEYFSHKNIQEHLYYVATIFFFEDTSVPKFAKYFVLQFVDFLQYTLEILLDYIYNFFFNSFHFFFNFSFTYEYYYFFILHSLIFIFTWPFHFSHQVLCKGQWWRKFKQTNVLQKLPKILLIVCTPKKLWCKNLQATKENNISSKKLGTKKRRRKRRKKNQTTKKTNKTHETNWGQIWSSDP